MGLYNQDSFHTMDLPEDMKTTLAMLANHSLASRTWSTYKTVQNHLTRCQQETNIRIDFPMNTTAVLVFTHWLFSSRSLSATTVNTYIAGLRTLHLVKGFEVPALRPPIIQQVIEGRRHIDHIIARVENKPKRLPVTLNIMKLLKIEIKNMAESPVNKALLWSVCTIAFNGCMRIHELLARKEGEYDPQVTLLRKDVVLKTDEATKEIQIKLKSPKEDRIGKGKIVDIYENKGTICPVRAFERYTRLSKHIERNLPIFRLENGSNLTGRRLNKTLKSLLGKHLNYNKGKITSHSFRAGLATLMGQLGFPDTQIMAMGRWSSSCFEDYMKLPRTRRIEIAQKIGKHLG